MIVHCPRCGFSQPEDQYCAQCGVNMHSFKRVEKSAASKFFSHLGVQVSILLIGALVAGSYIIQSDSSPKWVQKLTRFQGPYRNLKTPPANSQKESTEQSDSSSIADKELNNLENTEIVVENPSADTAQPAALATSAAQAPAGSQRSANQEGREAGGETTSVTFKLTYMEVSTDTVNRWVAESSRLGLFQVLQEYSAGILPDFRKRGDKGVTNLKTTEKKLTAGQSETNLSGTMNDDGRMIGLSALYEVKSFEPGLVHGTIVITRANQQSRDNFPAEFDLPKGSVFFMVDILTRQSFGNDQAGLAMAPFQIFKSPDFQSQKSKFVVILEPEFK